MEDTCYGTFCDKVFLGVHAFKCLTHLYIELMNYLYPSIDFVKFVMPCACYGFGYNILVNDFKIDISSFNICDLFCKEPNVRKF
jgi:hypothetical protein